MRINHIVFLMIVLLAGPAALGFGGGAAEGTDVPGDQPLEKITLVLDWVPNTNHTGAYVAQAEGFFAQEGLDVEIVQPSEIGADAMVAAGRAEFGFSYQEGVTFARTAQNPVPVVSIAAVIQHNTSGFAGPASRNLEGPADFEGKRYGGWGSAVEEATIHALMEQAGADPSTVEFLNIGSADFFQSIQRDIDFAWIFWAWTGIEAQIRGVELDYVDLGKVNPVFDYYTPVIITSESLIEEEPGLISRFLAALTKGYEFAMTQADAAAAILVEAVPEIPLELARESQAFLADQYQAEAPVWGHQRREVWSRYAGWLYGEGFLEQQLDVDQAYTNEFLPR
ncbi:ABC transporter substrate-binding protein [Spirochaeta lutea]|uniref:ABC transporter substrate-binding protein n=1 Tax=Spirochaeta lutea TaxID=1480694 RepID=A0A098QZX0_9SPIO|nr:ABC transporter substrate-binding protein [Spirochaeta lutea]KGE73415.1 ABC transporter substrate-binding protein [Spirochaeta lutea]